MSEQKLIVFFQLIQSVEIILFLSNMCDSLVREHHYKLILDI